MSQFPSMPLFIDAYLADTTHFSAEEHGAYLLLLMAMWRRNGWVPNDDRDLARLCGCHPRRWPRVKRRLMPMLIEKDGELSQKKLGVVLDRVKLSKLSDPQKRASDRGVKSNEINAKPSRASPSPKSNKDLFSDALAPSFHATLMNGSAAIGASPGFGGRYAPTPSNLTRQLVARGLHKP